MSDIVFACLHCGQSLAVEDSACGMAIDCPKCQKQLVVPNQSATLLPEVPRVGQSEGQSLSQDDKSLNSDNALSGNAGNPAEELGASASGKSIIADKRLLAFVRWTVIVISLGMIISVVAAGIHLQKIHRLLANRIDYQDIQKTFQSAGAGAQSRSQKSAPEIKFPDTVKKYYPDRNLRELLEWLEKIDPEKRSEFIANMADVIKQAEAQKAPDMRAVIVEYQRQKRLMPDFRATDVYSARPALLALISFVVFLIGMLLAFCCLLLILLVIEKKTLPHQITTGQ